jgi:hypothetical protein
MRISWPYALIIVLALAGCAYFASVYRRLDTKNGQGVLVDIKQRAILASTRPVKDDDWKLGRHIVVCAEPSPDALSAHAVDMAGQASLAAGNSFKGGLNTAENSAFVGLRTQSIQLLRDQFFRACEAYLNRAASAGEYNFLIRRYQKQTAALLAIEQLTSTVSVPAAAVSAATETKTLLVKGEYENNLKEKGLLEKSLTDKALNEEQKTAAKARIETLRKTNVELILSLKPADQEKLNASAADATKTDAKANDKSIGDITAVAQVVQHIVDGVISNDDFLQLCIIKYGYLESEQTVKDATEEAKKREIERKLREDSYNSERPPYDFFGACLTRMKIENDKFEQENHKLAQETRKLEYENAASAKYVDSVVHDSTLTRKQVRDALSIVFTDRTK